MLKSTVLRIANLVGETGCYRFLSPETVPVFMLHRICAGNLSTAGATSVGLLRSFLVYLKAHNYNVLKVDEFYNALVSNSGISPKTVVFTVDDGFVDQYQLAASLFDEFDYPLNFFVISDFLDGQLWPWDVQITYALMQSDLESVELSLPSGRSHQVELTRDGPRVAARKLRDELKLGPQSCLYEWIEAELFRRLKVQFPDHVPEAFRAMSWDNARELQERGHHISPHTCTHRILSSLTPDERKSEIFESQRRVELELGQRPEIFAYPTGRPTDYDKSDIAYLENCGFKMAFTTVADYVKQGNRRLELPRFPIPASQEGFRQIVNRFEVIKSILRT